MIVVGIDPGYAIVGYGVLEYITPHFRVLDYGAVTTSADMPFERRLELVYDGISEIFERHKPDAMAVEQLFFTTNRTTGIAVAQARGAILLAAQKHGLCIAEYTPLQVKQAVTGYGKAEKAQVMEMTRLLLKLKQTPKPDDTADALAVAICHAHSASSRSYAFR